MQPYPLSTLLHLLQDYYDLLELILTGSSVSIQDKHDQASPMIKRNAF